MLQTISQITLCIMLVITTTWCIIVYRKLVTMKSEGGPLKDLIVALNQATKRADQTILAMRLVIKDADQQLAALAEFGRSKPARPSPVAGETAVDDQRRLSVLAAAARKALESDQIRAEPGAAERKAPTVPARQPDEGFAGQRRAGGGRMRRYEDSLPSRPNRTAKSTAPLETEAELEKLARSIASLR